MRISGNCLAYSASKSFTPSIRSAAALTAAGVGGLEVAEQPVLHLDFLRVSAALARHPHRRRAFAGRRMFRRLPGVRLALHLAFHGQSFTTYFTAPGLRLLELSSTGLYQACVAAQPGTDSR